MIDPLFMDELNAAFEEALARPVAGGARRKALQELHHRIGTITVLDPACGSGNFLTESYLSLRQLENRILFEMGDEQLSLSYEETGEKDVLVTLANYRGIELEDFACCVARTALWIAEKQADADTAKVTRRVYQELPLTDYANVVQGDALAMDWADVVDVSELDYVIGNPPFLGASNCNAAQKAAVRELFGGGRLAGSLDYVSGWYVKTACLMQENPRIRAALVSTNSICQGEQVAPIWGTLFGEYGVHIDFAWDTFFWASESDDPAHVHCVIVGFSRGEQRGGTLYDSVTGGGRHLASFSPYLRDLPLVLVPTRSQPICDVPRLVLGNKPSDGGNLILSDDEKDELLARWPQVAPLVRRYVGAEDFLHGRTRWCLWLLGSDMALVRSCPEIVARVNRVRELRLASSAADTRRRAEAPWEFFRTPLHDVSYLVVPGTTSERRRYIPVGYFGSDTIPSNATSVVADASLYHFGILSSSVHMAWVRTVCGRLKSDYRYSGGIVYNNFPWPEPTPEQRERIESCARAVLDARANEPSATLAEMYDPELAWSFSPLMDAHRRLDDAVADAYRTNCDWKNEESVVGMLFELYKKLTDNRVVYA